MSIVGWLTAAVLSIDGLGELRAALEAEAAGDAAVALKRVDALVRQQPTWELPRLEATRLRLRLGQSSGTAQLDADVARSLAPENPRAHYLWALVAEDQGHHAEARRALEVAVTYRPDFVDALERLGAVLIADGDFTAAVGVYRALLQHQPSAVAARFQLATALERKGALREAEHELRALAEVAVHRPVAMRKLVAVLEKQGRTREASALRDAVDGPRRKLRELKPSSR